MLGEDDVASAFRHILYNAAVIGMHCCLVLNCLLVQLGQTFGDNTSPSNWEVIAQARSALAKWMWHRATICRQALPYLPDIQFEAPPTAAEVAAFTPAERDAKNPGVHDKQGHRLPPPFAHWVDDNMYADIRRYFVRTLCASVLALYVLLGFPHFGVADPVSWDKFCNIFGPTRVHVGFVVNSRTLTFDLAPAKIERITELLTE